MTVSQIFIRKHAVLLIIALFLFSSGPIGIGMVSVESSIGDNTENNVVSTQDTTNIAEDFELRTDSTTTPEDTVELETTPSSGDYSNEGIAPSFSGYGETWMPDYDRSAIEWSPIEDTATYRNLEYAPDGGTSSIESVTYNALTGVESTTAPEYTPRPETGSEISVTEPYAGLLPSYVQESVYGDDDRTLITNQDVFPWRTIVKLYITAQDGSKFVGSGMILDDFHVMTAGHCAYLHDHGGWASSIEIVPAMDTADTPSDPYGHAWVTLMRSYTAWVNDENSQHDWAVLTLDRNIGTYTGWMGRMTAPSDSSIYTDEANVAGYPADLSSGGRLYYSYEPGRGATSNNHYYEADTAGGMSGCPVWRLTGGNRYIMTVHAYGGGGSPNPNYGTRLNQEKYDRIFTWLGADTAPTDKPDMTDRGSSWHSATSGPITATVTTFTVSNDVRNVGTDTTGGFWVHYYASSNNFISTADYYIGSDYLSSMAPFSEQTASWSGTFPDIPAGDYYIGWIIDKDNNVDEFDENNNKAYIATKRTVLGSPPPTGYIEVRVRDSVTLTNLQTAFVEVYDDTDTLVDTGYTDSNGFYNVTALDVGWYTIDVSRYAYYSQSKQNYINWDGDDDYLYFYLEMMPEDSGYIEVNVKDSVTNNPISGALVKTYNTTSGLVVNSGYSDASGFYNVTNLRVGWYEVRASKISYKLQMKQNYINWNGDDDYLHFYLEQFPPDSGFIEVRVYNETGSPREAAFVECVNDSSGLLIDSGYTNINGFYNITGLTIGWYTINVTYAAYYEQSKSNYINWYGDDDYLTYYLMSMPPDSGYIEITVYDSGTLSPISVAYVEIVNDTSASVIQTGWTDFSGFFKAENLTIGWYTITVTQNGYYDQSVQNYINWNGDDDYINMYLDEYPPDSGYIEVYVRDSIIYQPLENALVTCNFANGTYFTSGYTDASGLFNVTGLYVGWYEIVVTHPDYGGESKQNYINWNGDDDYLYYYLEIKPPGYIEITVINSLSNGPMENAFVQCYNYTTGELFDSGYTDNSGFYNVTDLLKGWWVVNVSYPGFRIESKLNYINWRGDDDYLTFYLSSDIPLFTGEVAIFRDRLPWNLNMTEPILDMYNISYTIYNSSDFGQVNLSQYRKVIIPSDQTSEFYAAFAGNRSWFENFASQGGILDLRLADYGWGMGNWDNMIMPGGLNKTKLYLDSVDISMTHHTLVNSPFVVEDVELDGWLYSAHGYFNQYPEDAHVICVDHAMQEPVLLEFRIGAGFAIATMQTLEWNENLNYTSILENMILYDPLLGFDWVSITNPSSASSWHAKSTMGITWDTTGTISDVKLELYDDGSFVMEIVGKTPNDGEFSWNIPEGLSDSNQYYIVISDYTYPSTNGTSENFEIFTDVTSPDVDHPIDIIYFEGTTGHSIDWTPSDDHPVSYEIFLNGSLVKSGLWNSSSESISILIDGLDLGIYNYTIVVMDIGENVATDDVIVTVIDGTTPVIDHPTDVEYSEGTTGHEITWTPTDAHPVSYAIYLDDVLVKSGLWNSSSDSITIVVDGLALGEYNYTIAVTDIGGNVGTDEVTVTVIDDIDPTIDNPLDIQYEFGTTGHNITWIADDLHPDSYEIRRNGTLVESDDWTGSSIVVDVDGNDIGVHIYTITVWDTSGNSVSDSVIVVVVPAGAGISIPMDAMTTIALIGGVGVVIVIILILLNKKK